LTATVSYYWSDEVFFSAYNRPEGDSEDSYHRTDAGLRLDGKDDTWYLAAGVQNIEDDEVATQATVPTTSLGGAKVAQWQPPRIWNVAIGYRFQ
jgi:outer membrane receptor protein involved in Fe transport